MGRLERLLIEVLDPVLSIWTQPYAGTLRIGEIDQVVAGEWRSRSNPAKPLQIFLHLGHGYAWMHLTSTQATVRCSTTKVEITRLRSA